MVAQLTGLPTTDTLADPTTRRWPGRRRRATIEVERNPTPTTMRVASRAFAYYGQNGPNCGRWVYANTTRCCHYMGYDATDVSLSYHPNHLYSVYAVTDTTGTTVERYAYDSSGRQEIVVDNASFEQPYGFTGRRLDGETGLWYLRARYFDDELGRFTARDLQGRPHVDLDGKQTGIIGHRTPDKQATIGGSQIAHEKMPEAKYASEDAYRDGYSLYGAYFIPNDLDPSGMVRVPWGPGTVTFTGCTPAQLASLAVIPETQPPWWTTPVANGVTYPADGFRGRGWPAGQLFKVGDHCDATVTCVPAGRGAFTTPVSWVCNWCASLIKGTPAITAGGHGSLTPPRPPF